MKDVLCVILGGGKGSRLYPLTKSRSKPAVPLVGKYRLIDIPVSNCLNSGFHKMYILTQFNSESLNKHITRTYKLDYFTSGFIEIMAAEQSMDNPNWYQGTADAVRRCLKHFNDPRIKYVLVLSGDQLYRMDLLELMEYHLAKKSEVTVACHPVGPEAVSMYGIMDAERDGRLKAFVEKPHDDQEVKGLALNVDGKRSFLASMGIYLFNKETLIDVLTHSNKVDFGREIIPDNFRSKKMFAYTFKGYWEDIGTIKNYYEASLLFAGLLPPFNMYDENWPVFTRPRYLPPAKVRESKLDNSVISEGAIIEGVTANHSVIGLRARIGAGTTIEDTIIMGNDYYETLEAITANEASGTPSMGIGKNCIIKGAIIDKNARIGDNVVIVNKNRLTEYEGENYTIKDGIVIIEKQAVLKSDTVI